jgi:uncharacterized OB-fold protein
MLNDQQDGELKFIEHKWFMEPHEGVALKGSMCKVCKKKYFPKKDVCPRCFDSDLEDVPLSKRGKLHTYTCAVLGPSEMEKPYIMGFIDLPEGIKLFSIIIDCEPWDEVLKIGMEMEMVIGKIKKDKCGNGIISYLFRPVEKESKI